MKNQDRCFPLLLFSSCNSKYVTDTPLARDSYPIVPREGIPHHNRRSVCKLPPASLGLNVFDYQQPNTSDNSPEQTVDDVVVCGLKKYTGNNTRCKQQEMELIFKLSTTRPSGLNINLSLLWLFFYSHFYANRVYHRVFVWCNSFI